MNSKILVLYDQLAKLSAELKVGETTEEPLGKTNLKNCISDQPENGFNMFQLLHPRKCQLSTKLVESKKLPSPQPFARLPPQSILHIAPVAVEARHVVIFGAEDQAVASAPEGVSKERFVTTLTCFKMFCVLGRGREGADNLDFCNSVDLYFQLSVTTQTLIFPNCRLGQ